MIRISLLPLKRSKKRDAAVREMAIGGAVIAALVAVLYVAYAVMDAKISTADENIGKRQADIARLEKDILKVDEFKKKKRELEAKLMVIEDLKAKKTGPVKLLDELASNIPKRVWLRSFEEKTNAMIIEGSAADNDDLSDFLSYMTKRTKFFGHVALVYSEAVPPAPPQNKYGSVKFKMTGSASYGAASQPVDAAPVEAKAK